MITQIIEQTHIEGLLMGLVTFLIIGLFHPLVIKGEYYFGVGCRWVFLVAGVLMCVASLLVENTMVSILLGVVAFSSFWSVKEVLEQRERVRKGWFPRNPKRNYDGYFKDGDEAPRMQQPKPRQR